jgi:hypothetical protein
MTDDAPPTRYLVADPCCPVCGCQQFRGMQDDPDTVRWHYIAGYCEDCGTYLEIEYAAVDVRVSDPRADAGGYSGVQSGRVPVSMAHYYHDAMPDDFDPAAAREARERPQRGAEDAGP